MRIRIHPGGELAGTPVVPGDKSIAHRWLMLAATAQGRSILTGLPGSLDVRSTAGCLARLVGRARPDLEVWCRNAAPRVEGGGSTWNTAVAPGAGVSIEIAGEGRTALVAPGDDLDCGNSGTSMRLLTGLLASAPFRSVLTGDESLRGRPMERVAAPLRSMGASIDTDEGHAPITVNGRPLHGVRHEMDIPSAQVKGALLLAGLAAAGGTTVTEPANTRDHTERALAALGAPIQIEPGVVSLGSAFQHAGFAGRVPGDPSAAAFLIAAAALTGSSLSIVGVGLNPTRLHFLEVMARMGIVVQTTEEGTEVGEPVGRMDVAPAGVPRPVRVEVDELPLVIDEVPVLALLAAHAPGDSWFMGARELRVKESDRLGALVAGIRGLGGHAADEGEDLVVAGGGLGGGQVSAGADHRMAMAFAVAALAADAPVDVQGAEAADVSFPGFWPMLESLGARIEVAG